MALDTYGDLITTVGDYLERSDMGAFIPTWVTLAEKRLTRRLNLTENETMARLDLVHGRAPLPDDYGSWRAVNGGNGYSLEYEAPHVFIGRHGRHYGLAAGSQGDGYDLEASGRSGHARTFTIVGSVPLDDVPDSATIWAGSLDNPFILTGPVGTGQITLVYRQTIPPLSNANPVNWLLERHPDAYLYAVLSEAGPFLKADANTFKAMLEEAIGDIQSLDREARWGRGTVQTLEATP